MSSFQVDYNAIASFERSKQPDRRPVASRVFAIALLAVFFVVLLGGLAAGAVMYRSIAAAQMEADAARMQAGLLASYVRAADAAGAVGEAAGPEGRALVLTEMAGDGSAYETRLYLHEGQVVQEYAMADAPLDPERAEPLIASDAFDFYLEGGLLVIRTDAGETCVALRSVQGTAGAANTPDAQGGQGGTR